MQQNLYNLDLQMKKIRDEKDWRQLEGTENITRVPERLSLSLKDYVPLPLRRIGNWYRQKTFEDM